MSKVFFLHPRVHDVDDMLQYLCIRDESELMLLEWDDNNPDIVFASELIFRYPQYMNKLRNLYDDKRLFVFHGGEAVYPDLNIFDYAIGYFHYLNEDDRLCYIPEKYLFFSNKPELKNNFQVDDALRSLKEREFCSFIYSNANAHPMRDALFYNLSRYKKVSSLGRHLHNTNIPSSRGNKDWLNLSVDLKSHYKFSISSENALMPGYTSEKLLSSFRAHTVPIFWGNPKIADYYNPKAFINVHDYDTLDRLVERVRKLDNDDMEWAEMVAQPWQTKEQEKRSNVEYLNYVAFLKRILLSDNIEELKRRPKGTFVGHYYEWFFKNYYINSYKNRVANKLKQFFRRR